MNLREWSNLTTDQRQQWLGLQSPRSLTELLVMIAEMLDQTTEMDSELSMLIDPDESVTNARNFTVNTLRNVEYHLTKEIRDRQILLEKTV